MPSQTFLGAHLVLERVRDLVGRWLPDLNPGMVVITLDISPPVAAGFAFDVLFLSDDVNMDVKYVQAWKGGPGKKIEINASGLMKGQENHQLLMETELLRQGSNVRNL